MTASKPMIETLILDLDNTLWDWVEIWYQSFSAMLREISRISGIPETDLHPSIREVHQRHGTAEYSFLIEELSVLPTNGKLPAEAYREAIEAHQEARKSAMTLYPTVAETLDKVRESGTRIVAYTESMAFYTSQRIRKLGLDGVLDFVYSPQDHDLPKGMTEEQVRRFPNEHYQLQHTVHRNTPAGEKKPNPDILNSIMREVGARPETTTFVGDSPMKDLAMAQDCGVKDVYAEYGKAQDRPEYELLRKVTHWTDQDVERERQIMARGSVTPTYVLRNEFAELLDLFQFAPAGKLPR